jgi:hypothetical protein
MSGRVIRFSYTLFNALPFSFRMEGTSQIRVILYA